MQISVEITNVIVDPEFNAAEIIITPIFSSGDSPIANVPIETISVNGTDRPIIDKNVDITVPTKTSDLTKDDVYTKSETYTQTEINNKLSAIYEFKGSVATYAELPTNAENADVWNVEENGINYAWVELTQNWDSLGGLIGLATLTENGLLSKEDFSKLQNLSGTNTGNETQSTIGSLVDSTELTEITDTSKIAASNGGVLNWFSGLRIYNYLKPKFDALYATASALLLKSNLSGGNIFLGKQDFDGMINHKAGEYFYTAASKTADTVNDTRVINSAGVEIHEICTVANIIKGSGTWIESHRITAVGNFNTKRGFKVNGIQDNDSFVIAELNYPATIDNYSSTRSLKLSSAGGSPGLTSPTIMFDIGGGGGRAFIFTKRISGSGARLYFLTQSTSNTILESFMINENGDYNSLSGKYRYESVSPTSDTINDRRTSVVAGVEIKEICTVASATKGGGTWKKNSGVSELGGQMISLTNKTGVASVKGTVVYASTTTDNAFNINPIDGDMPFGIVYESGIADGSECWVVISGIAEVLLVNSVASTRSYIAYSSGSAAGRIDTSASAPAAQLHFREIGHTFESKTAGTNVLCKCVLHFN